MSVMIGIARDGKICMAADSQWSTDSWDSHTLTQPKIERRGDILFSVGPCAGLEYALWDQIEKLIKDRPSDWWKHWATFCLEAADASVMKRMYDRDKHDVVQVGHNGKVFGVWVNGSISEHADGIYTTGCGGDYARAAAYIYQQQYKDIKTIAIKSCEVACELSAGCAPPIIWELM